MTLAMTCLGTLAPAQIVVTRHHNAINTYASYHDDRGRLVQTESDNSSYSLGSYRGFVQVWNDVAYAGLTSSFPRPNTIAIDGFTSSSAREVSGGHGFTYWILGIASAETEVTFHVSVTGSYHLKASISSGLGGVTLLKDGATVVQVGYSGSVSEPIVLQAGSTYEVIASLPPGTGNYSFHLGPA